MARPSKKWLLKFRQKKKSDKVVVPTKNITEDERSVDSLDEALNDMSNSSEEKARNIATDAQKSNNEDTQKTKNVTEAPKKKVNEEQPKLGRVDSKKMCLKLLRKYSRLAMEEQDFSDESTQRSSFDSSTYDETVDSGQMSSSTSDIPTVSTQTTISSNSIESSIIELEEQDETTGTATFASPYPPSQYKESPLSILLGPLLCGLATNALTKPSDESSCSYPLLYSKIRFVANCGTNDENENSVTHPSRNIFIKNITIDNTINNTIPSSFSISEVSDVTEIETSFTADEEDIITVFTCRSVDDKGVTLYSAISSDEHEDAIEHNDRYDI